MAHSAYYPRDPYYPDYDYHRSRSRRSSLSHPPTPASFHLPPISRSAVLHPHPATPFSHGTTVPQLPPVRFPSFLTVHILIAVLKSHGYPYSSYAGSLSNPHLDRELARLESNLLFEIQFPLCTSCIPATSNAFRLPPPFDEPIWGLSGRNNSVV